MGDRGAGWAYWAPAPPPTPVEPPKVVAPKLPKPPPAWEARSPADPKPTAPAVRQYFRAYRTPIKFATAPLEPCPICGQSGQLVQDHCHRSGLCRDRICTRCNVQLGQIEKPTDVLTPLLRYVAQWQQAHAEGGTVYSAYATLLARRRGAC